MLPYHSKQFVFKLWFLWIIAIAALLAIRLVNSYLSFNGYYAYVSVKPVKSVFEYVIPPLLTILLPSVVVLFFGITRFAHIRTFKQTQPKFVALSVVLFIALRFLLRSYFLYLYQIGELSYLAVEIYEYASYVLLMLIDITYTVFALSRLHRNEDNTEESS